MANDANLANSRHSRDSLSKHEELSGRGVERWRTDWVPNASQPRREEQPRRDREPEADLERRARRAPDHRARRHARRRRGARLAVRDLRDERADERPRERADHGSENRDRDARERAEEA